MRTFCELRILEEHADLVLAPEEGKRLGDSIREVVVSTDDARFARIGRAYRKLRRESDQWLFHWWDIHYTYSKSELKDAALFNLEVTGAFEPPGELCGTMYDYLGECPRCGAGRKRIGDLVLDLRRAPKKKDIARTIADDEVIVSQRLAELMTDAGLTGFELRPVRHKTYRDDDPVDLNKVPAGREILRLAAQKKLSRDSTAFWVWLNQPEQREMTERAHAEHAAMAQKRAKSRGRPLPVWYELIVTSARLPMVPPTRTGNGPFDDDPEGECRCPLGHVSGLNLLSEVHVPRDRWDGSDIVCTENMVGCRRGLLVPAPLMLISPRFWRLLQEHKIKGYSADVAYLV